MGGFCPCFICKIRHMILHPLLFKLNMYIPHLYCNRGQKILAAKVFIFKKLMTSKLIDLATLNKKNYSLVSLKTKTKI